MKSQVYVALSRAIPSLRHDPVLAKLDQAAVEEMIVLLNDELALEQRSGDDSSTIYD